MYFLNQTKHKTINAFCFNKSKHSAISPMFFLNLSKKCKTSAWFVLNYVKKNTTSVLCFLRMLNNAQITHNAFFKSYKTQNN